MKKTSKWIFVIIGILLIPVVLNFFLQIRTGLIILGGSASDIYWLSFWGSFLAAIAAVFLGWASLKINEKSIEQNKINIEQNDKILHNDAWNKMVIQYNKLENFIVTQEKLHSLETIETLNAIFLEEEKKNKLENKLQILQIKAQLKVASIQIVRFLDGNSSPCSCDKGNCLFLYGNALFEANKRLIRFTDDVYNSMISHEEIHKENNDNINKMKECYQRLVESCSRIMEPGFNYLKDKKNEIVRYAKEHNIEQGSFI